MATYVILSRVSQGGGGNGRDKPAPQVFNLCCFWDGIGLEFDYALLN